MIQGGRINGQRTHRAPRPVRCQTPYYSRPRRGVQKIFTPDDSVFPAFSAGFASPSPENHDFYPTARLHGGFIAM
jgi:hypothetical protein